MTSLNADALAAAAIRAERETLSRSCRLDAARLDAFLAPDFHEFGASGAELTKEGTAQRVAAYTAETDVDLVPSDMRASVIADGVVMVKYSLRAGDRRSWRTSLWRLAEGGQWQMFHHQGTLISPV